jgi:hypothetical protein
MNLSLLQEKTGREGLNDEAALAIYVAENLILTLKARLKERGSSVFPPLS